MLGAGHSATRAILVVVTSVALAAELPSEGRAAARGPESGAAESAGLRAKGLEAGYNLDHEEALAAFRAAAEADPAHPAPHRLIAAALWIDLLFQQGAVTIEDYLGQARTTVQRKPPSADLDRAFRAHIGRALALAEQRVQNNPRDADARFQVGAAHSFLASYIGTVEGRSLGALRAARRAYAEHERALELDARRKDAAFVVGSYRYGVSILPLHWRILAGIAGIGGGRERGLRYVEESAAYSSDVQTNALFTLVLIYNREARYDDGLKTVGELQRRYPRNRLLWLEAASTNLRAGRPAAALESLDAGLAKLARDPRPRAFGEEARWHYTRGAALVALGQTAPAERELRTVLEGDAQGWIRGRAHKELGKLADRRGDRAAAVTAYRTAIRLGRAEDDDSSVEEAEKLLRSGYRGR